MSKKNFTGGFDAIFAEPTTTTGTQNPTGGVSIRYTKKDGTTYTKHNFIFDDETFEKVRTLQQRTRLPQYKLMNEIVRFYFEQYEHKFGTIDTTAQLL